MWKMYDDIIIFECNECGGPLAPPPQFLIPPPPRPPAMADYSGVQNCNKDELPISRQQQWDSDMCKAIPILDASFYNSQSIATSVMVAVFSLLLILVVLISSLFVWKNKRKVQSLLHCKAPTRGPHHISGGLSAHTAATYEDPEALMAQHHRPLVMRHHHHHHHHNMEILLGKSIHYPSGYPMTRSPPFLVSSSPGPDPYRSNDNVYEELGPGRGDSDGESEPAVHSDDDFAEDELSLPGDSTYNKTNANTVDVAQDSANISTTYHERQPTSLISPSATTAAVPERHSVLSSSSSTAHDASTATAASSSTGSSRHNGNSSEANPTTTASGNTSASGLLSHMLRHTTGRSRFHSSQRSNRCGNSANRTNELNISSSVAEIGDIAPLYDNDSNMMCLGYLPHQQLHVQQQQQQKPQRDMSASLYYRSLHQLRPRNNCNARFIPPHFLNIHENEVERRNRINAQISQGAASPLSTIIRDRMQYPENMRSRPPQPNSANNLLAAAMRVRTNPRSMDRRHHRIAAPIHPIEPTYTYADPGSNQNYLYDSCGSQYNTGAQPPRTSTFPAYIMSDYTTSGNLTTGNSSAGSSTGYYHLTQQYAHGDSSFGSDSGYSHHTPASSIGRNDYDVAELISSNGTVAAKTQPTSVGKLSTALGLGWNRRKPSAVQAPRTLNMQSATVTSGTSSLGSSNEATSPNNNSACSTVTSQLENSSNSLSSPQPQNNNQAETSGAQS